MSPRSLPAVLLGLTLAACGEGDAPEQESGPVEPPAPLSITAAGITGAAPLEIEVRVDFVLPGSGFEAALFGASTKDAVFAGVPLAEGLTEPFAIVEGLARETHHYFGLGVRSADAGGDAPYVQAGAVVRVRTGEPIYVDALADPFLADGLTPATAFPDLLSGLLAASASLTSTPKEATAPPSTRRPSITLGSPWPTTTSIPDPDRPPATTLSSTPRVARSKAPSKPP